MSESNNTEEVARRIEAAMAAGDFTIAKCEACLSEKTDTYRIDGEIKTYCPECAAELGLTDQNN